MNTDELQKKLKEIKSDYLKIQSDLLKSYAVSNDPYCIGDIVTDHYHSIIIETKNFYVENCISSIVYYGTMVKKNGELFKNNKKDKVYQINIVKELDK